MKKTLTLALILSFSVTGIFADDLRKKAEDSPLDCALYLLSINEHDLHGESLSYEFFRLGRYDQVSQTLDLEDDVNSVMRALSHYSSKMIDAGNLPVAKKFVDQLIRKYKEADDKFSISDTRKSVIPVLARASRLKDLDELIAGIDDTEDKALLSLTAAGELAKAGRTQQAMEHLERAASEFDSMSTDDQMQLALRYAELKEGKKATEFLTKIRDDAASLSDYNNNRDRYHLDLIDIYLKAGDSDEATELWEPLNDQNEPSYFLAYARSLYSAGKIDEARAFLPLTETETDTAFLQSRGDDLVRFYLEMVDWPNAIRIARAIAKDDDDNSWEQQLAYQLIAEKSIAAGRRAEAIQILDEAFKKALKFKIEDDSGLDIYILERKVNDLDELRRQYVKLHLADRIAQIPGAFPDEYDDDYTPLVAKSYLDIADAKSKTLPKRELNALVKKAQDLFDLDFDDERELYLMHAVPPMIRTYARIGETAKANELVVTALNMMQKDEVDSFDRMLIAIGGAFADAKLKTSPKLRNALRAIIIEFDDAKPDHDPAAPAARHR